MLVLTGMLALAALAAILIASGLKPRVWAMALAGVLLFALAARGLAQLAPALFKPVLLGLLLMAAAALLVIWLTPRRVNRSLPGKSPALQRGLLLLSTVAIGGLVLSGLDSDALGGLLLTASTGAVLATLLLRFWHPVHRVPQQQEPDQPLQVMHSLVAALARIDLHFSHAADIRHACSRLQKQLTAITGRINARPTLLDGAEGFPARRFVLIHAQRYTELLQAYLDSAQQSGLQDKHLLEDLSEISAAAEAVLTHLDEHHEDQLSVMRRVVRLMRQ